MQLVKPNVSDKIFEVSHVENQSWWILSFTKDFRPLRANAMSIRTIKQLEIQTFEKQQIYSWIFYINISQSK